MLTDFWHFFMPHMHEFYFFLTLIWVFRACLADFLEPWPLDPIAWAAILQAVVASALAFMMVVLSIRLLKIHREKSRKATESVDEQQVR